jgi:AraC-like DNA-binding protein
MKKTFTKTFKNDKLPFMELRHSNSNMHYKKHFHDTFSLGVNKKGQSRYFNSGKEYVLKANGLSIINPSAVHACNASTEVLNEYFMMYLDTQWCVNIQKLICDKVTSFVEVPVHLLDNEVFYKEYVSLCDSMFENSDWVDKEDALISFFMRFFALFLEQSFPKVVDEKFEQMVAYLHTHYQENISLEELAQQFDLNSFYVIRLFKSQVNLTPRAYLINVKINKSKEFLQQGMSIVDVALECGFFDQSHFHKNFLKIVATTPKQYQLNFVQ